MKVRGILIITWQTFELFLIVSCIGCVNTRAKTNRNQEATNTREKNRSIVDFVIQIVIHGCACYSQNKYNNEKIHYLANFYSIFFSKWISTHKCINKYGLCVCLFVWTHACSHACVYIGRERERPITTVMLEVTTSVTDKPTNAQAYCVDRLPRLSTNPPAIANNTEGQLSCIRHPTRIMNQL